MKKIILCLAIFLLAISITAPFALAAAEETARSAAKLDYFKAVAVATAIGIAIAAFGGALGQGKSVSSAVEGIARNPGASGKITVTMVIGLALIESLVIYALVVVLILFFGDPFKVL